MVTNGNATSVPLKEPRSVYRYSTPSDQSPENMYSMPPPTVQPHSVDDGIGLIAPQAQDGEGPPTASLRATAPQFQPDGDLDAELSSARRVTGRTDAGAHLHTDTPA